MAIDPSISLGVTAPPQAANNPLQMVGQFANIQNALNQNRLFQQSFAARQRAGEIMATAPDTETGLNDLYRDPLVAPFAPQIINTVREGQQTAANIAKLHQDTLRSQYETAQSGLGAFYKTLGPVMQDPSQWNSIVEANLSVMPPELRARVAPAFESIRKGLVGDNPTRDVFQGRIAGLMMAGGIHKDDIAAQAGTVLPQFVDITTPSGQKQTVLTGGPVAGAGSLRPLGSPPMGQAGGTVSGTGGVGSPNSTISPLAGSGGNIPYQTLSTGPTITQQKYAEARAADMAKYQQNLDDTVNNGRALMMNIQEARDAMKNFKPGAGATMFMHIGQVAQFFGASPDLIHRIIGGDLGAMQEFQKLMVNTTTGQMKQQIGVNGTRYSQMELQTFMQNNPHLDTDPDAINKIFNFWTKIHSFNSLEQSRMNQYLDKGGDISKWPAVWNATAQKEGMLKLSTDAFGKPITADPTTLTTRGPMPVLPPPPPGPAAAPTGPAAPPPQPTGKPGKSLDELWKNVR